MSEWRIALVAEGTTDQILIEAALRAILPRGFILTLLQPEATRPTAGGGWCGVLKWCRDFRRQGHRLLEDDPTLGLFDLIIIHLDADVADDSYDDCGAAIAQVAAVLPGLPCSQPCPPPSSTVDRLHPLLLAWLGIRQSGSKTVFCIPSKSTESWLAAALLPDGHPLLPAIECNLSLETRLAQLPKNQRLRKSGPSYRRHALAVTTRWARVCALCSQATAFHCAINATAQSVSV